MTREEAEEYLINLSYKLGTMAVEYLNEKDGEKMRNAIKALEEESCEDAISRKRAIEQCGFGMTNLLIADCLRRLPPVTPQEPKCKDCKWWKDSDGVYRRGCGAESQCPINRKKVYEGNGYCYLFEPQERSDKE